MNKRMFIVELKELIEKYKIDKISKIKSDKLAKGIFWLIVNIYEWNSED